MHYSVYFSDSGWHLSGVNTFTANLIGALRERDIDARLVTTGALAPGDKQLARPTGIPADALHLGPAARLRGQRNEQSFARVDHLRKFLEARAPCVYVPNYDFEYSYVSGQLSPRVAVLGIVHSDDPEHYRHAAQLGRTWNAAVGVSRAIGERLRRFLPDCADRIEVIRYGVAVPAVDPPRCRRPDGCLRLVYVGRIIEQQKRVSDLVCIARELKERRIDFHLSFIGDGPERGNLTGQLADLIAQGLVTFEGILPADCISARLQQADALLLTSAFEGLPLTLLEAMACGCVPIVSDIRSGIPELVRHGINGFRVPLGDIEAYVDSIARLQSSKPLRQQLSQAAYEEIRRQELSISTAAERYAALLDRIIAEARQQTFVRLPVPIVPSRYRRDQPGWRGHVPAPVRHLAGRVMGIQRSQTS